MKIEELDMEIYDKKDKGISMEKANIIVILMMLPIFLILSGIYYETNGKSEITPQNIILALIIFIVGVVIHEIVHGVMWSLFCEKKLKSIKFGFDKKTFTPYAHCTELLSVSQYRIGTIAPAIVTGIIPYIISLNMNSYPLTFASILLICTAGGDLLIFCYIIKEKGTSFVIDHNNQSGCVVYRKK